MRNIIICPVRAALRDLDDPGTDFIICSTELQIEKPYPSNVLLLPSADTEDETHPLAFSAEQAERVVAFFRRDGHNQDVTVCCDAGESRSAAITAALMVSDGQSDKDIWGSTEYHPNILVFRLMCHELGVQVGQEDVEQRRALNDKAIHEAIQHNRRRL